MLAKRLTVPLCLLLLSCTACEAKKRAGAIRTPTPAALATPNVSAACRMLSADDVREVQGEAPQEAQGGEHVAGGLTMSQCFYRLPTFSKSVNIEVLRPAPGSSPEVIAEFWRQRFHTSAKDERAREKEEEAERERQKGREKGARAEEEREAKPLRVEGVGEEAYWSGNQITAALSVLGKDAVLRVSIGGPDPQEEKIKKARTLALKILGSL